MAVELRQESRLEVAADVFAREFDGELVVLDLVRGDYFGLDEVGSRMWTALAEGRSVDEVARAIHAEYDASPEVARADVLAFAKDLVDRGLLKVRAA